MRRSSQITGIALAMLLVLVVLVWYAAWRSDARVLTVSFLDVGQGDAIYIESPAGRQALIDGGPDTSILRALSRVSPWYNRSLDLVIGTHPDQDHIGGLIDVLDRYRVDTIVHSRVQGDTSAAASFQKGVASEGARVIVADRGQIIDLGGGAYIEILFPDRDVARIETNVGCVVARVVYGETAFMLPCDATDDIELYVAGLDGAALKSNVLKAAHHGSKTSSAAAFVGYVDPEYAIYSRGCDNSYGHPHEQTIQTFARLGIPTLDTCEEGTITFVSDGQTVVRK